VSNYGDYPGLTSVAGRGDGSDGGTDNRPYLVDGSGLPAMPSTLSLASVRGRVALDWAVPSAPPTQGVTATIGTVAPDPRETPVDSLSITFNAPVFLFQIDDVHLTRGGPNGVLISLSGATLSGSGASYVLSGLASKTAEPGVYTLTLFALGSRINTAEGLHLAANATRTWRVVQPKTVGVPGLPKSGHRPVKARRFKALSGR